MNKNNLKAVIEGYNGRYEIEIVGNDAIIFDTTKNEEVRQEGEGRYKYVFLEKQERGNNGDIFTHNRLKYIYELVAETFVPNPLNWRYIHFKNGSDINPNNLVWSNDKYGEYENIDLTLCYEKNRRKIYEEWKEIEEFKGYYISNLGRVVKDGILLERRYYYGYYGVNLSNFDKTKNKRIHRLVAEAFVQNPNNYKYVKFKDNNYANLCVDNLYYSKKATGTFKDEIQNESDVTSHSNQQIEEVTEEVVTSDENIEQDNNDTKTPKERLIDISIKMVEEGASDEEIRTLITMLSKM